MYIPTKSKGYETTETIPPRIVRHADCLVSIR